MSEALGAYWTRTLRQYLGSKVRVTTTDGRKREGMLTDTPAGPRLFTDEGMARLPLGQIQSVTVLE